MQPYSLAYSCILQSKGFRVHRLHTSALCFKYYILNPQLLLLRKPFTFGCSGEGAQDPCLPVGYSRDAPAGTVVGSGNFEECRAIAKGLIAGQCQDELCPIGDSMPVELQGRQYNGNNGRNVKSGNNGAACFAAAAHCPEQCVCTTLLVS